MPLAGFRSERAAMAFSPFCGGSQPWHRDSGSFGKLLYLHGEHREDVNGDRTVRASSYGVVRDTEMQGLTVMVLLATHPRRVQKHWPLCWSIDTHRAPKEMEQVELYRIH